MADARPQLLVLLERDALDPVLHASPDGRSEADRRKLTEVQTDFKRDLSPEPARKVHRAFAALGVPALDDVRDRSEAKTRELKIDG